MCVYLCVRTKQFAAFHANHLLKTNPDVSAVDVFSTCFDKKMINSDFSKYLYTDGLLSFFFLFKDKQLVGFKSTSQLKKRIPPFHLYNLAATQPNSFSSHSIKVKRLPGPLPDHSQPQCRLNVNNLIWACDPAYWADTQGLQPDSSWHTPGMRPGYTGCGWFEA